MFMTCSNSVLNPDKLVRVETENETSLLGTLVHAQCESLVSTGSYDLLPIKQRVSVEDYDRAGLLFGNFLKVWKEAAPHMPHARTEVYLEAETPLCKLTGNIDCLDTDTRPKAAFVLDYKTGRQHEDHFHQMAGYAFLVWVSKGRPPVYTVFVSTVYLEDNSVTQYTFTAATLAEWEGELTMAVRQVRYTAGRKCAFCTLQGSCPAYHAYVSGSLRTFTDDFTVAGQVWEDMTVEQRGDLIDRMYVVEKAIDRIKLSLRNVVRSKGSLAVGPKTEYVLVEKPEASLNARKALPVLNQRLGPEQVAYIARLPLNDVLDAYAARAAKGSKTRARKELFEELDAAGAVVRTNTTSMWRRPKGEKTLEESNGPANV